VIAFFAEHPMGLFAVRTRARSIVSRMLLFDQLDAAVARFGVGQRERQPLAVGEEIEAIGSAVIAYPVSCGDLTIPATNVQ
jgi:hypothetical protein